MRKEIRILPDKTIELSWGDRVEIYVKKNKIEFHFACDGDGNCFELTKDELREMLK
jgi:hypothetical protein